MKITLTTWERVQLAVVVGSGTGTIAQIRLGNKALDMLEMTGEEKAEVSWLSFPDRQQVGWQVEKDWGLEFRDDVWQLVQMYTVNFQKWPQDRRAEVLYDKVVEKVEQLASDLT